MSSRMCFSLTARKSWMVTTLSTVSVRTRTASSQSCLNLAMLVWAAWLSDFTVNTRAALITCMEATLSASNRELWVP